MKDDLLFLYWDLKEAKENGADVETISDIEWAISAIEAELGVDGTAAVQRTFEAAKALGAIETEAI